MKSDMSAPSVVPPMPAQEGEVTVAEGAGLLAALSDALRCMEQATAKAVDLVGRVQRAGVTEIVEGVPLELLLRLEHRLVSADSGMLLEAARLLRHLPVTKSLFDQQKLSWGQIRGIVARLRRLTLEDLDRIDERVGASVEQVDKFNPDELVWAVGQAADEIDGARLVERREQRAMEACFVALQPSFDGSVRLYGELDPIAGATCLNALDAASDPPLSESGEPGQASGRARQRAQGLTRICSDWLGGNSRHPARPLLVAHVDIANATTTAAGTVELATPGILPTLTAAAVEVSSRDADMRVVLFDGARPLAASSKTRAAAIPSDIRLAVAARDRGCRFPGSTAPTSWAEQHHLIPQEEGGEHHPENLASLVRRWHFLVHRRGWEQRLDPDTGEFTITRNGRTWRSLPRGTPLNRPPPPPKPPD